MNPHREKNVRKIQRYIDQRELQSTGKAAGSITTQANIASKNADQGLYYTVLAGKHLKMSPSLGTVHRLS